MMVVAQSVGAYTEYVAYGIGGLVLLVTVAVYVMDRHAGETDAERQDIKAASDAVRALRRSKCAVTDDAGTVEADLRYLATTPTRVGRLTALRNRLRRYGRGVALWATPATDHTGADVHLASVDGRRLANRDVGRLLEDVATVVEARLVDASVPPTFSEYYYNDLVDGYADYDASVRRCRNDCQRRLETNLDRNGELEYEKLRSRMVDDFRYPEPVFREKLGYLWQMNDVRIQKDGIVRWQRY